MSDTKDKLDFLIEQLKSTSSTTSTPTPKVLTPSVTYLDQVEGQVVKVKVYSEGRRRNKTWPQPKLKGKQTKDFYLT